MQVVGPYLQSQTIARNKNENKMTWTDLFVNLATSVPVIFEPPCVCVCIYIYIYVCLYIYTYIYVDTKFIDRLFEDYFKSVKC